VHAYEPGGSAHEAAEPPTDDASPFPVPVPTTRPASGGWFITAWRRFSAWRRRRPFWGAVLAILGGAEILTTETIPFRVIVHIGLIGQLGYVMPVLMMLCGILLLFAPQPRAFYASLVLLASLATWITSNLGGFFLGMLLGLAGGALALSWTTAPRAARTASGRGRH
jgi:uncharacterized protein DUF6114